ncbi:MAG: DUF4301 family protein [Bacteroidales bacterium]|nr:DUF4301 family protein [Bacteroidales bacterium]
MLNRPIRICGMVALDGDTGGGPFWIETEHGTTIQIVETAQIDLANAHQKKIFESSSHFNPVDLVCSVKSYKGEKFDLMQYRDPEAVFISKKSVDGKDLKALELPGLWNGSMAHWLSIFVDVPGTTFSPVKTLNDLLNDMHLS